MGTCKRFHIYKAQRATPNVLLLNEVDVRGTSSDAVYIDDLV